MNLGNSYENFLDHLLLPNSFKLLMGGHIASLSTAKKISSVVFCHWCWFVQSFGEQSAIDNDLGPPIDSKAAENYRTMKDILQRLMRLCVVETNSGRKPRKHEQRLLRNMGAHSAILELLEIPYEKVIASMPSSG